MDKPLFLVDLTARISSLDNALAGIYKTMLYYKMADIASATYTQIPTGLHAQLLRGYQDYCALEIRKVVDKNQKTHSYRSIISMLELHQKELNRSLLCQELNLCSDIVFDKLCAAGKTKKASDYICNSFICDLKTKTVNLTQVQKLYFLVNKRIAHHDCEESPDPVLVPDMLEAVCSLCSAIDILIMLTGGYPRAWNRFASVCAQENPLVLFDKVTTSDTYRIAEDAYARLPITPWFPDYSTM